MFRTHIAYPGNSYPFAACYCMQRLLTIRLSSASSILATANRPAWHVVPGNVESRRQCGGSGSGQEEDQRGVLQAFDLTGNVAATIGGNMGLGEAFAHALTEAATIVAVAARTRGRSESIVHDIEEAGGNAAAFVVGETKPPVVRKSACLHTHSKYALTDAGHPSPSGLWELVETCRQN